jgi:hypothetical protein
MGRERSMSTGAIVALALSAGAAIGLLVGRLWAQHIELQARHTSVSLVSTVQRTRDPARWVRDSTAREQLFHAFPSESPPRELRREHILSDCLVTLPDTTLASWVMFTVYARDSRGACSGGRVRTPTRALVQATA